MANHDNYDKDLLKALQKIANSLDRIEKKMVNDKDLSSTIPTAKGEFKCNNCKFHAVDLDAEPCISCDRYSSNFVSRRD